MNTSSTSPSKTLITAEPKPKARKRMGSASASTAPSWMSFTGWRSAKRSTARSTSCRPTLMWDHRIQRAPAPSGSLVLWQDPDADLSWRATTGKGKTHGGMTTRDSHIGSHCQHRLSDQVPANTLVLAQIIHVEVAMLLEPVLVGLDRQGPYQPQAAVAIGKDAHDLGAAPDLLVQPLQHVGRLEMLVVLARQPIERQCLVDVLFDPAGELGVFA